MNNRADVVVGSADPELPGPGVIGDAAEVFGLLADEGRLRLLAVLTAGECAVGDLARAAGMSESATSHALRLLRAHRVVQARRDGRLVRYRLQDDHVTQLLTVALEHAAHSRMVHPEQGAASKGADAAGSAQRRRG